MSSNNNFLYDKNNPLGNILVAGGVLVAAGGVFICGKAYYGAKSLFNKYYGSKKTLKQIATEYNISLEEADRLLRKLNDPALSPNSYLSKGQLELLKKGFHIETSPSIYKPQKQLQEGHNIYMLDTNVLLDRYDIITIIGNQDAVLIPIKVVDELDKLKISQNYNLGIKAKIALKLIRNAIKRGDAEVVSIHDYSKLPPELDPKSPDNMIICSAIEYNAPNFILVTSDNGLIIKTSGYGIKSQTLKEYCKEHNVKHDDRFVMKQQRPQYQAVNKDK